jgi:hypothetical protein
LSFSWDWTKAWSGLHGAIGPVITRRLRAQAPGHGTKHAEHVATITHRTSVSAIQWVGAWTPWGFVVRRTKPHVITPKSSDPKARLAFTAKDGTLVFARLVHHPGTQANRFPMRVWRESLGEIKPILKGGVKGGLVIRQINPYRAELL